MRRHPPRDLSRLSTSVRRGASVNITGEAGSGRSTLLRELDHSLISRDWTVVRILGHAAFRQTPLAALALAGVIPGKDTRPQSFIASLTGAIDELVSQVPPDRAAILVDDWDDLDEASWGVICAVRSRTGVPVVTARTPWGAGRGPRPRSAHPTYGTAHELRIQPLAFSELERILQTHLDAPLTRNTLSRIFAKSGGNPGLALALVDAAVAGGKLTLHDGQWRGAQDLWTDTLGAAARVLLDRLTPRQRDLLEVLATVGTIALDTVARQGDLEEIEQLEADGLVSLFPSDSATFVTVEPPLLVEYFRHETAYARRYRLATAVASDLGNPALGRLAMHPESQTETRDARLVRLVHERARDAQHTAQQDWRLHPSIASATRAVRAGMLATAASRETVESIVAEAEHFPRTAFESVAWVLALTDATLAFDMDVPAALRHLREAVPGAGEFAETLTARHAFVSLLYAGDPQPARELADATESAPVCSRAAIWITQAVLAVIEGRISESRELWHRLDSLPAEVLAQDPSLETATRVFRGLTDYLGGDPGAAVDAALADFSNALAGRDVTLILTQGSLCATLLLLESRHEEAGEVLECTTMLGTPAVTPAFVPLTLAISAAVLASRRGHRATAEQRSAELGHLRSPDIPLPGGSRSWATVQMLTSTGKRQEAADLAIAAGDQGWERGERIAAAYAYLGALDVDPNAERLAHVEPRLAAVASRTIQELALSARAWALRDRAELMRLAEQFAQQGRISLAISAYKRAAVIARTDGQPGEVRDIDARLALVLAHVPAGRYDPRRGSHSIVELSTRELRIAQLARAGLTNQQIADELILSVRTVESHLYRIMRKLGIDRRAELADHITSEHADAR
ncbi:helix-turn-helix transcriptional regulator [Leucobacter chromiireducens]|uniref:helix-turn-helix transcriptional regulator n=1 Tax=Leucobacter chromiireducens TaxID=283877 RepID=UPI001927E7C1|nr:LuxR family transcriptional regulator [Leucobacter chromiireducens]